MPNDPRTRGAANGGAAPMTKPVLLAGQDAMDEDEDMPVVVDPTTAAVAATTATTTTTTSPHQQQPQLLSRIITPAPVPTSSRYRNALARITTNPQSDAEAWQALMTQVQAAIPTTTSTSSMLPNGLHAVDAETQAVLDWVESCFGALLHHFPTASQYQTACCELLLQLSARVGEEGGPAVSYGLETSARSVRCDLLVGMLLQQWLGVDGEGNAIPSSAGTMSSFLSSSGNSSNSGATNNKNMMIPGLCSWNVDLWLLYIRKVTRDARRARMRSSQQRPTPEDEAAIRKATLRAYDTALHYAASAHKNHVLWKAYLAFVRSWTVTPPGSTSAAPDHALQQEQMLQLRNIYKRAVVHPMTGLDQLWQEYEAFERGQNEALAQALTAELAPKYQHARTVYLERNRVYSPDALQWNRLATLPAADVAVDAAEGGAGGGSGESKKKAAANDPTSDAAGGTGAAGDSEDYQTKMADEHALLQVWKTRCAYERTNPERLSPTDLSDRIRRIFYELLCVWTRHAECWTMWSTWEMLASAAPTTYPPVTGTSDKSSTAAATTQHDRAWRVLELAQEYIPDCTLLAYQQARIVEQQSSNPADSLVVLDRFVKRAPNTLGFVLLQKSCRHYQGREAARAVFARARRTLVEQRRTRTGGGEDEWTGADKKGTEGADAAVEKVGEDAAGAKKEETDTRHRWIVTNRLDPSIATANNKPVGQSAASDGVQQQLPTNEGGALSQLQLPPGPITWHLYASHAMMEHRLNRLPEVAARVYELGLRKHASFLTKPPYILRYAQLLLELGDNVNLRALLKRAVAACQGSGQQQQLSSALAAMWDMTLHFESMLSGSSSSDADGGPSDASTLQAIEAKRHQALMGPDIEDVATGGLVGSADTALIGAQKSSIAEQLVRTEGYDISSSIVNGMSRTVEMFGVMGLWGNDDMMSLSSRTHLRSNRREESLDDIPGGKSDAGFQKRLAYMERLASGISGGDVATDGVLGSKILSARERRQQGSGAGGAGAGQNSAIMLSIQQSAEWLRPLLLLLPASRLRLPIVAKPPPHLTEMALTALIQNQLPAERPADSQSTNGKRSRSGNDSDDENGGKIGGGFGNQFRSRQRARQQNGMMDL